MKEIVPNSLMYGAFSLLDGTEEEKWKGERRKKPDQF